MAVTKDPWFVTERSEAAAVVLLTGVANVVVAYRRQRDDGVDLGVGLDPESPLTRQFIVQVKGTVSENPAEWAAGVKHLFTNGRSMYLPACVFVVDVRDTSARYAWLAEPSVKAGKAVLKFHAEPHFEELNSVVAAALVNRVAAFYAAVPKPLLATV